MGEGKSTNGDYYSFQLQLDFDANDTKAKVRMSMQGYRDNELNFACSNIVLPNSSVTTDAAGPTLRETGDELVSVDSFSSERPELRLIEYTLGQKNGKAVAAYRATELKRKSSARKVPIVFEKSLCSIVANEYSNTWSITCNNGKTGSGKFTGADSQGHVAGEGVFDGAVLSFVHRKCFFQINCSSLLQNLIAEATQVSRSNLYDEDSR